MFPSVYHRITAACFSPVRVVLSQLTAHSDPVSRTPLSTGLSYTCCSAAGLMCPLFILRAAQSVRIFSCAAATDATSSVHGRFDRWLLSAQRIGLSFCTLLSGCATKNKRLGRVPHVYSVSQDIPKGPAAFGSVVGARVLQMPRLLDQPLEQGSCRYHSS